MFLVSSLIVYFKYKDDKNYNFKEFLEIDFLNYNIKLVENSNKRKLIVIIVLLVIVLVVGIIVVLVLLVIFIKKNKNKKVN